MKRAPSQYLFFFLISVFCLSTLTANAATAQSIPQKSRTAQYLDSLGLVNIADLDTTIAIHLVYTTPDNFTGEVLYDDLKEAYLLPQVAEMLINAQRYLKEKHPSYTLIVYDAARPMSVQKKMWNMVKGSDMDIYVGNPARGGGMHNYGAAVDVTILDSQGNPLSMGTKFDHFGEEAHITNEQQLVEQGIITSQERTNRVLLREVMRKAGFKTLHSEWWHFNYCSRSEAIQKYKVIE